jgi:hypothetical protein
MRGDLLGIGYIGDGQDGDGEGGIRGFIYRFVLISKRGESKVIVKCARQRVHLLVNGWQIKALLRIELGPVCNSFHITYMKHFYMRTERK